MELAFAFLGSGITAALAWAWILRSDLKILRQSQGELIQKLGGLEKCVAENRDAQAEMDRAYKSFRSELEAVSLRLTTLSIKR